ncbi:MAG: nuclear transport factor 2 family protein [Caulobacter sp.]|nr:nuclear transport factor 2 family protein [Caulobacter sp.]
MEDLVVALAMCVPITSGPIPSPVAVVEAFTEAYNAHDVAKLRELVAADARMGPMTDKEPNDGRAVLSRYETVLFKRFPKVNTRVVERISASDMVAQTESITGVDGEMLVLSAYRVDRGCIVEMSYSQ